jgi:hypothetical protein
MKKAVLALILGIALLVAFGMEAKAQIPKEGTISNTWAYSGTYKALPMGKERLQMTYEVMGVIIGGTSEDLFHNASFRCLGGRHAVKGEYNDESGFCVCTRPDGDQMFLTYKATGKPGVAAKETQTIVGGTGKLAGIQGNAEYTRFSFSVRPVAEGTFQGYEKGKGQYKLP